MEPLISYVLGPSDTSGVVRNAVDAVAWGVVEENVLLVFGVFDAHEGVKEVVDVVWGVGADGVGAYDGGGY